MSLKELKELFRNAAANEAAIESKLNGLTELDAWGE